MTIEETIKKGTTRLKGKNIDSPKLKARLLMQAILGQDRQYLLVYDKKEISQDQEKAYFKNIEKI